MNIDNLEFDSVAKIMKFCNKHLPDGGAAFFVVREICERIYREYDGQGIPIDLHSELSTLVVPMTAALQRPNDIVVLNDLVRQFGRIKF